MLDGAEHKTGSVKYWKQQAYSDQSSMAPTGRVQQGHYEVRTGAQARPCSTLSRFKLFSTSWLKRHLLCAMLHWKGDQPSQGTTLSTLPARLHADGKLQGLLPLQHPEFLESLGPVLEELKAKVDAPYDVKQLAQLLAQFLQFQEDALGIRVSANQHGCLPDALHKSDVKLCSAAAPGCLSSK